MMFPYKCPACGDFIRKTDLICDSSGIIDMWICGNCSSDMIGCFHADKAGIKLPDCLEWLKNKQSDAGIHIDSYRKIIELFESFKLKVKEEQ